MATTTHYNVLNDQYRLKAAKPAKTAILQNKMAAAAYINRSMKKVPLIYHFIRGAIGNSIVVKHYSNGIVFTKFPDMTNIKPSPGQYQCRNIFKEAVAFARTINNDPAQRKLWKQKFKKGTVYNNAIRHYMMQTRR